MIMSSLPMIWGSVRCWQTRELANQASSSDGIDVACKRYISKAEGLALKAQFRAKEELVPEESDKPPFEFLRKPVPASPPG